MRTEEAADVVQTLHGVAEQLPQGEDQDVSEGMAVQGAVRRPVRLVRFVAARPLLAAAFEAVLDHLAPEPAPLVVAAQRR